MKWLPFTMTSSRRFPLTVCLLCQCWLFAVNVVTTADPSSTDATNPIYCDKPERFMNYAAITAMKNVKRCYCAMQQSAAAGLVTVANDSTVTPCIFNGLVDYLQASILLKICNQLSLQGVLSGRRRKRAFLYDFVNNPSHAWNSTIPYSSSSLGIAASSTAIPSVLNYVQQQTCIRFTQLSPTVTPTLPYIDFIASSSGCQSFYGRSTDSLGSPIALTAACAQQYGQVLSLVSSTLGMWPEDLRTDRSQWIVVNSTAADFFIQVGGSNMSTPYDYTSISHPYSRYLATSPGYTLLPLNPILLTTIGQQVEWSFYDAKAINTQYCSGSCAGSQLACQRGGYPDPNNCSQCKCPDGFGGTLCDRLATQPTSCGAQLLTATSVDQFIKSPNYASPYPVGTACTWQITAADVASRIQLTFIGQFDVFQSASTLACYHWVEVRYNGSIVLNGPRFCGQRTPIFSLIADPGVTVLVIFRANYVTAGTNVGFNLRYRLAVPAALPCQSSWPATPSVGACSAGGSLVTNTGYPQFLSLTDCLNYCLYDVPGCLAVDVDYGQTVYPGVPNCWIHTSRDNIANIYSCPGVNQYRLAPCPTTTTTTGATSTAGCVAQWTAKVNQHSAFGVEIAPIASLASCQLTCNNDINCVAIDWDYGKTPPQCWLHYDANNLLTLYPSAQVTQYVLLSRCDQTTSSSALTTSSTAGCVVQWASPLINQNSINGQQLPGNYDLSQCQSACNSDVRCVAIDWDTTKSPPGCWLHLSASDLNSVYGSLGVLQYRLLSRCTTTTTAMTTTSSGCQPLWITRNQTHAYGATLMSNIVSTSITNCLNYCASSPTCVAVDIVNVTTTLQCWVHSNSASLKQLYFRDNCVQYELVTRCSTAPPVTQGNCGGNGCAIGCLCEPCKVPVYPPQTCFVTQYAIVNHQTVLVTVQVPCQQAACASGATLITTGGSQYCVWIGWSNWSSCNSRCNSQGYQSRDYWNCASNQYMITQTQRQSCYNYC